MRSVAPSLRLRLLAAAVVSIVATLVVAGLSLGAVFERQVLKRVDQDLQVRWDELAAAIELDAEGLPRLSRDLTDPRYHRPYSGAYWQIVENGAAVATSRSLWDVTLDTSDRSRTYNDSGSFEVLGPNDAATYVLSRPVSLGGTDLRTGCRPRPRGGRCSPRRLRARHDPHPRADRAGARRRRLVPDQAEPQPAPRARPRAEGGP